MECLQEASKVLGSKAIVGQAQSWMQRQLGFSILAGADFVVSPAFDPALVEMCHRYGKIVIPGAFT